ncbi:YbbR-like domain-containing protein [Planctomycetota bacterium]
MIGRFARAIVSNWHLKLMSLGLAIMSWFLVTAAGIQELEIEDVPVAVEVPVGVSVWEISRAQLKVKLKGPRVELSAVRSRDLAARCVVPSDVIVEGETTFDVDCKEMMNFSMPVGVRVTEVEPAHIKLKLVPKVSVRMAVDTQFVGKVKDGFEIAGVRIVPARVSVAGPEPLLADMKSVQTLPVNCDGRFESFSEKVIIENEKSGHRLEIAEAVEVRVDIAERLGTRVLKNLSINVMRPLGGAREVTVVPDAVDVTVKAQKKVLEELIPDQIEPFVRVDKEGKYRLPVRVNVHKFGVRVVGELPSVEVTVRR